MGYRRAGEIQNYHKYVLQKYHLNDTGAHAVFLVYDITNQETFESIKNFWLNEVESYADPGAVLVLIGIVFLK